MNWAVDYTSTYRSDVVGIDPDVDESITDTIMGWLIQGPPRENERNAGGMILYEARVAGHYAMTYIVDDSRKRFAILWLRNSEV